MYLSNWIESKIRSLGGSLDPDYWACLTIVPFGSQWWPASNRTMAKFSFIPYPCPVRTYIGHFMQIDKTSITKSFLPGPHLLLSYHNFKKKDSHMGQFLLGTNFGFYFWNPVKHLFLAILKWNKRVFGVFKIQISKINCKIKSFL